MKLKIALLTVLFLFCKIDTTQALVSVHTLESPNKEHKVEIMIGPIDQTWCRIFHKGQEILQCSNLGFQFENDDFIPTPLISNEYLNRTRSHEENRSLFLKGLATTIRVSHPGPRQTPDSWKPLYGERNEIPDIYYEKSVEYEGLMKIVFRAYNEGIAFRYEIETKNNETIDIKKEMTSFVFPDDYPCWSVYTAQGLYEKVPLSKIKKECERPLLIQYPNGKNVSIGEAGLVNFARMRLQLDTTYNPYNTNRKALQTQLAGPVKIQGNGKSFRTPWRYVMVSDRLGELLERNYLLLNLNEPCKIADTSWIKPGKIIRETTLTTVGGKACVDFAVDRGLQYIEYDAGWYGPEHVDSSDATTVTLDPKRNPNPDSLDLHEVIRYAESKGIGVILYVNQRALAQQLDDILPLFQKWGVKGIKFGFVHVGSQQWTTWLHEAIAKCAEYQIMVDVHDEYRPTGWERTYPNLMTVEGIRGNEEMPTSEHNVITALTRMLCGPGDCTACWYINRIRTSQSHQLAIPIVIYSPWAFLYWYDRPHQYQGEPELDLWKRIPTVWDETKVIIDDIPHTVGIARRSGDTWYLGIFHGGEKKEINVALTSILGEEQSEQKWSVETYTDALDVPNDKNVQIKKLELSDKESVQLPLRSNGGAVVVITPLK